MAKYTSDFDDYASELINGKVNFASIGQFGTKVLYLAPIMNDILLQNHDVVSRMIDNASITDEAPQNYDYYQKNQWQPHCTLAVNLDEKTMITAIKSVIKTVSLITAKIKTVALVECEPYLELPEYTKTIKVRKEKNHYLPFSVKVVSKIIVEGKPDFKDKNYVDDTNYYEEQVLMFYAKSFDDAYHKAEKYMNKQVSFPSHKNIYGQTVRTDVLEYVNCYHMFESPSNEEPEIYSNIYSVSKNITDEDVLINRYDYYVKDEDQVIHDEWEKSKRKMILNAEFQKKR
ncbi:DUF4288 domain-containing protein [Acholeplasma laidlawii]|uniref:DUF4288 domain-containing protein n=1 Tax=Acholeplasma laidlawii TaxID=2148 RepID=UPI0021F6E1BB|nr:DUF4288 domain-containing protein [Acholeplasma laidlawii]